MVNIDENGLVTFKEEFGECTITAYYTPPEGSDGELIKSEPVSVFIYDHTDGNEGEDDPF